MRYYRVKKMPGFAKFKSVLCRHSVATTEFNGENSRCRTQAAKAMNEHAISAHRVPEARHFVINKLVGER